MIEDVRLDHDRGLVGMMPGVGGNVMRGSSRVSSESATQHVFLELARVGLRGDRVDLLVGDCAAESSAHDSGARRDLG